MIKSFVTASRNPLGQVNQPYFTSVFLAWLIGRRLPSALSQTCQQEMDLVMLSVTCTNLNINPKSLRTTSRIQHPTISIQLQHFKVMQQQWWLQSTLGLQITRLLVQVAHVQLLIDAASHTQHLLTRSSARCFQYSQECLQ